eukprot:1349024-Lingulodinium_polyedra.AAC.1
MAGGGPQWAQLHGLTHGAFACFEERRPAAGTAAARSPRAGKCTIGAIGRSVGLSLVWRARPVADE